jgi:hypothetical protein
MKRRHSFAALFPPLLASLSARARDEVVLTFDEIEALWGEPLPMRAKVNTHAWTASALPHVRVLHAAGWRAHLEYVQRRVVFRRLPVGTQEG